MPFIMNLQGSLSFSRGKRPDHLGYLPRDHVGCDADHALRAQRHEGKRERVVAAENFKAGAERRSQLCDPVGIAARLLNANDVLTILCQPSDRFHADLDSATPRNTIKHYRQARVARDFPEVLK